MKWLIVFFLHSFLFSQIPLYQPNTAPHHILQDTIQVWISNLQATPDQAKQASLNLRKIGGIAVPQLMKVLPNHKAAKEILEILAVLPPQMQYIPKILEILKDNTKDIRIREAAISTLRQYATKNIVKVLWEEYCKHPETRLRRIACHTVLRCPPTYGIPYWIEMLDHKDSDVQNKAFNALLEATKQVQIPKQKEAWKIWWEDTTENSSMVY